MKLERNGIDLSLDYNKVAVLEKVEAANRRYQQNHRQPPAGASTRDAILHQVQEIFAPINEIYADTYGPNVCERIFDMGDLDYNDVMDVYLAIIDGISEAREVQTAKRLDNARKSNERLTRIRDMQAEADALEAQNVSMVSESEAMAGAAAQQATQQAAGHDTSVAYRDMGSRPRIPLAVQPAPQQAFQPVTQQPAGQETGTGWAPVHFDTNGL